VDVLILFTALAWKHAFADLFLQTLHYSPNKSQYISNAHRHYAEHGLLTVIICMFFVNPWLAFFAGLFDYICHWHIDFAKDRLLSKINVERGTKPFFRIQAFDQILHFLTYAIIVFILLLR
jgi:flagellar biosynthesis protein FlhB